MKNLIFLYIISFIFISFYNSPAQILESNFTKKTSHILVADTLPADLPLFRVDSLNSPCPGYEFYSVIEFDKKSAYAPYLEITDTNAKVNAYKKTPAGAADFKMHSNGLFSYGYYISSFNVLATDKSAIQYICDKNLKITDSVQCGNGYLADTHEFIIMPNGHYLLMSLDQQMMDLSTTYPGASSSAVVVGTVYQELDGNKKVIFQWRSLDHVPLDNLAPSATPLGVRINTFDHAHGNSAYLDWDNNWVFSFFSTSELIKVDRNSGAIIWRLGGKHNEFKFIGDQDENSPYYFSFQHNIQKLQNGHLLMYDNGRGKKDQSTRIVEYILDETNKTCSLFWEYRHQPDIATGWAGSVQKQPNGNYFIGWGFVNSGPNRSVTEVKPSGQVVEEKTFINNLSSYIGSYRAFKYPSLTCDIRDEYSLEGALQGNTYRLTSPTDTTGLKMEFQKLVAFRYNIIDAKRFDCSSLNCSFDEPAPMIYPGHFEITAQMVDTMKVLMTFDSKVLPNIHNPEKAIVYLRDTIGSGKFKPLPTQYNSTTKELSVTLYGFGEFVVGVPFQAQIPAKPNLVFPANQTNIDINNPPTLKWALLGYAQSGDLQVALDNNFNNKIIDTAKTTTALFKLKNLQINQTYYWRVKANNTAGTGAWSDIWSFTAKSPYINLLKPNGADTLVKDSNYYVIRWDKNTTDLVRVSLYQSDTLFALLKDSLYTTTNAYDWMIAMSVPAKSGYKIKVQSVNSSTFFAESKAPFTITDKPVAVEDAKENSSNLKIFPNPFQNTAQIQFNLSSDCFVSLKIYNYMGIEIETLENKFMTAGVNNYVWSPQNLPSGVFYCVLKTGIETKKIALVMVR